MNAYSRRITYEKRDVRDLWLALLAATEFGSEGLASLHYRPRRHLDFGTRVQWLTACARLV